MHRGASVIALTVLRTLFDVTPRDKIAPAGDGVDETVRNLQAALSDLGLNEVVVVIDPQKKREKEITSLMSF